jgi:hypothetical protein
VLAIDHASRFVDCRDRSQAAVIAPTAAAICGDGSNLPDFAEVAFVLVAGLLLPEPLWFCFGTVLGASKRA